MIPKFVPAIIASFSVYVLLLLLLLLLLRSCSLAVTAERFDDVCELGELSGGDDLGEPSPKRARYKYSIQRIGNQSDHLFLTNQ